MALLLGRLRKLRLLDTGLQAAACADGYGADAGAVLLCVAGIIANWHSTPAPATTSLAVVAGAGDRRRIGKAAIETALSARRTCLWR